MRWLRTIPAIVVLLLGSCDQRAALDGSDHAHAVDAEHRHDDGESHTHPHADGQRAHDHGDLHAAAETVAGNGDAECTCDAARLRNRWCRGCGVGYIAGVAIPSAILFDALDAHGHVIDPDSITCDACRTAHAADGFCERDRWGFVGGQLYFTRLTWAIARGEPRDPASVSCERCRLNAASGGWCDACGIGMAGNVAFADEAGYRAAAGQLELLRASLETLKRCETCAIVMFTGATCPRCRLAYRDGDWIETNAR